VAVHLPVVKVARVLHGVSGVGMSGGGGCEAVRSNDEKGGAGWLGWKGEVAQERRGRRSGLAWRGRWPGTCWVGSIKRTEALLGQRRK
jgi:hypothetical protein